MKRHSEELMPTPRDVALRFLLGGTAGAISSFIMHPMDTMKIRLQLDNELSGKMNIFRGRYYKGIVRGMYRVTQEEGIRALYQGASATILRELTYGTIRSGTYEPIKQMFGEVDRNNTDLRVRVKAGICAGLIASAFTTPTDLVKVRLQADGLHQTPRAYTGPIHCVKLIVKEHGLKGLFNGATPNMTRACCLTSMQFPVYDHVKHVILNRKLLEEGALLHFISAMLASLAAVVVSNPADIIKTRIMKQRLQDGKYHSPLDALRKTMMSEGPLGLMKGTTASWFRMGPSITLYFIFFEQLRKLFGVAPI